MQLTWYLWRLKDGVEVFKGCWKIFFSVVSLVKMEVYLALVILLPYLLCVLSDVVINCPTVSGFSNATIVCLKVALTYPYTGTSVRYCVFFCNDSIVAPDYIHLYELGSLQVEGASHYNGSYLWAQQWNCSWTAFHHSNEPYRCNIIVAKNVTATVNGQLVHYFVQLNMVLIFLIIRRLDELVTVLKFGLVLAGRRKQPNSVCRTLPNFCFFRNRLFDGDSLIFIY